MAGVVRSARLQSKGIDSIGDVVRVMGAMAQGDLTQTIVKPHQGSFGEMKLYVNDTVAKLSQVVIEVNGGVEALASASEEVSAAAGAHRRQAAPSFAGATALASARAPDEAQFTRF